MSDVTEGANTMIAGFGQLGQGLRQYGADKLGVAELERKRKEEERIQKERESMGIAVEQSDIGSTTEGRIASAGFKAGDLTPAQYFGSFTNQSPENKIMFLADKARSNPELRQKLDDLMSGYKFINRQKAYDEETGKLQAYLDKGLSPKGQPKPKTTAIVYDGGELASFVQSQGTVQLPVKGIDGKEIASIDLDLSSSEPIAKQIMEKSTEYGGGLKGFLGLRKTLTSDQKDNLIKMAENKVESIAQEYVLNQNPDYYGSHPDEFKAHYRKIKSMLMGSGIQGISNVDKDGNVKGYRKIPMGQVKLETPDEYENNVTFTGGANKGTYNLSDTGGVDPEEWNSMLTEMKQAGVAGDAEEQYFKTNPDKLIEGYQMFKSKQESDSGQNDNTSGTGDQSSIGSNKSVKLGKMSEQINPKLKEINDKIFELKKDPLRNARSIKSLMAVKKNIEQEING